MQGTESGDASGGRGGLTTRWARRLGAWAFLFFLVKGLLWLAIPAAAAAGLLNIGS